MRVFLAPALFLRQDVDVVDLIEVICHGFDGRHDVLTTTPTHHDPIKTWLDQQGQSVREKCRLSLDESGVRAATQPSLSTIRIDVAPRTPGVPFLCLR